MNIEKIKSLIMDVHYDIEFEYNGKNFSITWFFDKEKVKSRISFCEFYKDPIDVDSFEELCNIEYQGNKLIDILAELSESKVSY